LHLTGYIKQAIKLGEQVRDGHETNGGWMRDHKKGERGRLMKIKRSHKKRDLQDAGLFF